jgi:hypothetical protein
VGNDKAFNPSTLRFSGTLFLGNMTPTFPAFIVTKLRVSTTINVHNTMYLVHVKQKCRKIYF